MIAFPRIQTAVIFVACILAVFGVAYYVHGDFWNQDEKTDSVLEQVALETTPVSQLDVNYDWTEQFLDDDKNNEAFIKPKATAQKQAVADEKLTPTQSLARNFLTKYAELKKVGLTEDPASIASVMDQVVVESSKEMKPPKFYEGKDILVLNENSNIIKNYEQVINKVHNIYENQTYEAEIAIDAFESGDMGRLKLLDPIIANYKSMISTLIRTPVSAKLAQHHLDLINGLSLAQYSAEAFRHIDTEPFLGFASIRLNAEAVTGIAAAYEGIQKVYDF